MGIVNVDDTSKEEKFNKGKRDKDQYDILDKLEQEEMEKVDELKYNEYIRNPDLRRKIQFRYQSVRNIHFDAFWSKNRSEMRFPWKFRIPDFTSGHAILMENDTLR